VASGETRSRLQLLQETDQPAPQPSPAAPNVVNTMALNTLMLALGKLSQRATVAIAQIVNLAFCFSAFMIFWYVLPNPSVLQLTGAGMYSVFVIVLVLFRRSG